MGDVDLVILPGGFSYGDYLRCGAIARFSPIMADVIRFARDGGMILGICNGFQILTEAGLLPGTLLPNTSVKFICKDVFVRVASRKSPITVQLGIGDVLRMPIAHAEGNYFADEDTLKKLEKNGQVLFQYCDETSEVSPEANPNGSMRNIAGIVNEEGNVLGMMPHPERCAEALLGNSDGLRLFETLGKSWGAQNEVSG